MFFLFTGDRYTGLSVIIMAVFACFIDILVFPYLSDRAKSRLIMKITLRHVSRTQG